MNLTEARRIAEWTKVLFEPFCERIEIVGSVRRQRLECNDVDLVCIPKIREEKDLMGEIVFRENLLRRGLMDYVRMNSPRVRWLNGLEPANDGKFFTIAGIKCQLDFFMATPETWATTLLTRTGSKEHNIWISQRAHGRGGHFKASEGIWLPGRGMVHPETEEAFYEALGLPLISPVDRERSNLVRMAFAEQRTEAADFQQKIAKDAKEEVRP